MQMNIFVPKPENKNIEKSNFAKKAFSLEEPSRAPVVIATFAFMAYPSHTVHVHTSFCVLGF
jgi:hypothetical protein